MRVMVLLISAKVIPSKDCQPRASSSKKKVRMALLAVFTVLPASIPVRLAFSQNPLTNLQIPGQVLGVPNLEFYQV